MNVKTTIVLLVLLIACAGYVLVFHTGVFGSRTRPADTTEPDTRLMGEFGKVQRLMLERPGSEKIVFVRRDDKWHITKPIDAPATDWAVDAVAATISSLRHVRKYADDEAECPKDDLAHLSAPLRTVTLTDDKEQTRRLKVGQKVPLQRRQTYVQLAGDNNVYVVEADLHTLLGKTLTEYRRKYVARFETEKATRITVRGDENYRLVKVNDKWAIDSPVSARAEKEKVEDLLRAVSDIRAEKFVDDSPKDLAPYGLDNPRLLVTVELVPTPAATKPATQPKGKVVSIAFGASADKKVFAKLADRPWVFQTAEANLADLQPKLISLRDKRILDVAGKEVTRIETSLRAGGSATLKKDNGKWQMLSPFKGDCENSAVHNLLMSLQSLKAGEFRDNPNPTTLAAFGLKPPQGKITLHLRGSDRKSTLLLGRKSDSGQMGFVMPAEGKSVAVIASDKLAKLTKPSPAYWNRTILKLPEDAIVTSIDLDRTDGKLTVTGTDEGGFQLTRPIKADADAENVGALLKAVRNIRAERIVVLNKTLPKRFAGIKGIRARLTYRTAIPTTAPASRPAASQPVKSKTSHTSLIVIKDRGKSYIRLEGADPIVMGEFNKNLYDTFAAEMRDRVVLKIDTDKIISFSMDLPFDKISMGFARTKHLWRDTADRFVKIDAGKVKRFLSGLSEVKAERFADYSAKPDFKRFGLDKPAMTIAMKTDDGKQISLKIARTGPVGTRGLYAVSSEVPGVFVLSPETSVRLPRSSKDFQETKRNRR